MGAFLYAFLHSRGSIQSTYENRFGVTSAPVEQKLEPDWVIGIPWELIWISRSGMKCLTVFMRLACGRRRSSEIGIADRYNDLGAMVDAIALELFWNV